MTSASEQLLPLAIVGTILAAFVFVGLRHKTLAASEYDIRGRYTGRLGGGAAIASNWMSAASFLGMAGLIYLYGYFALAYVIGWTGGYVLLLVLMAEQIRRFGKFTAPEFVGDRYASPAARLIAAGVSIGITVIYCIAQFKGIGIVFGWLFGVEYRTGVLIGVAILVSFIVLCGMLGVTRSQQFQYLVIITAFILPLMYLAHRFGYFWVLPQFGYGAAMDELATRFKIDMAAPFAGGSLFQWTSLCFTLMVGTAGLPHVLSRFYVVPNVRDARWSVVWGLFFIALVYWSAPAYAVFARLMEARAGAIPDPATARQLADGIVLTAARQGGVPPWLLGVLAAGAVSAAFFTTAGLLMTGAASFSHDIYASFINRHATDRRKMSVAKSATLVLAGIVLLLALNPPGLIAEIADTAFALAGNTIFPVFLLGIWWGRTNGHGAIAGMLTGIAVTFAAPLLGSTFPLLSRLFPVTSSAFFGAPLVILVIITVSLLTPPPDERMRRFLADEVHGHLD